MVQLQKLQMRMFSLNHRSTVTRPLLCLSLAILFVSVGGHPRQDRQTDVTDYEKRLNKLAAEIGLNAIAVVGNKIRGPKDREFLENHLPDFEFLGFLPYDDTLIEADLNGVSPFDVDSPSKEQVKSMISNL